jgi:hypothetical protein
MRKVRRQIAGQPVCDLCCKAAATDWHHIWTRYLTMGNEWAGIIASGPEMTALLCRDCHAIADFPENRNQILYNLYLINGEGNREMGYAKMKLSEYRLLKALGHDITWHLLPPTQLKEELDAEKGKERLGQ